MLFIVLLSVVSVGISQVASLQPMSEMEIVDFLSEQMAKKNGQSNYYQPNALMDYDDDAQQDEIKLVTAEQVSPIISGMLGQLGTAIQPLLGPLAPLSNILGPMITSTVTDLVTSLLNRVAMSANRQEFSDVSGYDSYVVNIPNRGQYVLLKKSPSVRTRPVRQNPQQQKKQPQQLQQQPIENDDDSIAGTLEEFLVRRPVSVGSNLYDGLRGPSGGHRHKKPLYKKKHKKHYYQKDEFIVPMNYAGGYRGIDKDSGILDDDDEL